MANIIPFSFKGELFSGGHNFANGGDTFIMSLYTGTVAAGNYTTASTIALLGTVNNEVDTTAPFIGYSAKTLVGNAVDYSTAVASVDWGTDPSWTTATFTAAYAAIYNSSTTPTNKLVVVLDFGGNKTATNGTFTVAFPSPAVPADAIISMANA
jgi:hypothetical protein|tara:strand:+ start:145 stop:606 length:462 start_codon:yes stop_codon:yes gene_type:complete